ncbi:MAG: EutN/CcmL family microcompartment protein [Anaerolineaceae bacterium]|nr:EutN/CcmL family microcompartment protein [Anaerolineaceae bacterium]
MILAKVIGTVVTTIGHVDFKNRKLLLVQPLGMPGEAEGGEFIALDATQAGIGDTVLINREGGGNRQVLRNPDACVNSVIVGIVDSMAIKDL